MLVEGVGYYCELYEDLIVHGVGATVKTHLKNQTMNDKQFLKHYLYLDLKLRIISPIHLTVGKAQKERRILYIVDHRSYACNKSAGWH